MHRRSAVSAASPDDYFVSISTPPNRDTADQRPVNSGGPRLGLILLGAVCSILAVAGLWFFAWRHDGIDGHASTATAFAASFPGDWHCQGLGDVNSTTSILTLECSTGVTYGWVDHPLPEDYAERVSKSFSESTVLSQGYQCIVTSGTAFAWIRNSVASAMTTDQQTELIRETADSFDGDATLIGPECP